MFTRALYPVAVAASLLTAGKIFESDRLKEEHCLRICQKKATEAIRRFMVSIYF